MDQIIDIGSRRELFVEDTLIDCLEGGAQLRLHEPSPREIAIVHDEPWEGSSCGYHTVFQDGELYRMYYRGMHFDLREPKPDEQLEPVYCYAESDDGVNWRKPALGIVEYGGTRENNIILEGVGTHNFSPFKDANPDCEPSVLYKGLGGLKSEGGLFAFKSADGINWSLMVEEPVITNGAFDSQNVAFWDENIGMYRAYWRYFTEAEVEGGPSYRAIRTGTSTDFLNWDQDTDLSYFDSPDEQIYTNQVFPYHRAPHVLVGLPTRYVDNGWTDSTRALPELENREKRSSISQRYGTAVTEGLFMASRDGVKFKRWNEAFVRPGVQRPGSWYYGHQYSARGLVETESELEGAPKEISMYYNEGHPTDVSVAVRRYTIRLDGFVSVWAPSKGGELLTNPILFNGNRLSLNFSTSAAGGICVEVQDPDGIPKPGFALSDCHDVFGDEISRVVTWDEGDIGELSGRPVRLRFALRDADLYSFRFTK
jgi:hypothetical protein